MDWIKIISIILLFFLWAYILYRWKKTERELKQSKKEIQRYQEEELKKGERHRIDANKWLEAQKENGSIPIKQSFILKSKSGRYFQDILTVFSEHALSEKVMETTDDILKAKKYHTHKEANEEAIKYDFEVLALNTYVKEL